MPSTVVLNALVIKVTDYSENDRLLTLLSEERGRISVIAKGGRSVRFKYLSSIQLFTYSAFMLYEKNGIYWLKEAVVNTFFPNLLESIEKISLASYLADITYELSGENEPGLDILRLLLNTLYTISSGTKPQVVVKAVFELRAVCTSGFMPGLTGCIQCRGNEWEYCYFDVMNGCIICPNCFKKHSGSSEKKSQNIFYNKDMRDSVNALGERTTYIPVNRSVIYAIEFIIKTDLKRIFAFKLDNDKDLYDLSRLAEVYTLWHLERGFDTLDFYKKIIKDPNLQP